MDDRQNGQRERPAERHPQSRSEDTDCACPIHENPNDLRIEVHSSSDIVTARQQGRALAIKLGFEGGDTTLIVTVISEVARNMLDYAGGGEILMKGLQDHTHTGILIIAQDTGPGFADVAKAVRYGCLTRKGLGMGLPGARWLVDEFEVVSHVGAGTKVTMKKWNRKSEL
jgi:serine/threonine-protein kinase RsbT